MTEPFDPKFIRKVVLAVLDEMSDEMWRRVIRKARGQRAVKIVDLTNIDAKTHAAIKTLCKRPPKNTTSLATVQGHSCTHPDIRKILGIHTNDTLSKQRLLRALVRLTKEGKIGHMGETRARVYYLTPKS